MLVYPQLASGALAQMPLRKRLHLPTRAERTEAGLITAMPLPQSPRVEWELPYHGLTAAEHEALLALHRRAEGRRRSFLFVDPTANLLRMDDRLGDAVWSRDPLLTIETGVPDDGGEGRAVRLTNRGGAAQGLRQPVPVPSEYRYCLHLVARAPGGGRLALIIQSSEGSWQREFPLGESWQECSLSSPAAGQGVGATFGLSIGAGQSLEVCRLQAVAQPHPAPYCPGGTRGGVLADTRFTEDVLTSQTDGRGGYELLIRLTSLLHG